MTFSRTEFLILELMPKLQIVVRRDSDWDIAGEVSAALSSSLTGETRPRKHPPRGVYVFNRGVQFAKSSSDATGSAAASAKED